MNQTATFEPPPHALVENPNVQQFWLASLTMIGVAIVDPRALSCTCA